MVKAARRDAPRPFETTPVALRTALVVDPDDADRRAVVEELRRHGFSVLEASSGSEAQRLAVARRPWLVTALLLEGCRHLDERRRGRPAEEAYR